MNMMTIEQVKNNGWLIFEVITGSRAYNLATDISDTDFRGVFVLPRNLFYSLDYIPQVSNETNDIVYYELRRFVELLSKNNPNIIEMLATPVHCVVYRHEIMDYIKFGDFISRLCEQTFANYAFTQIKKAHGLDKKILNPLDKIRKTVTDFCYVYQGKAAIPLHQFLSESGYQQEKIGLSSISHLKNSYNLFYSETPQLYKGIVSSQEANDVNTSNIPETEMPVALLYFNKEAYSTYCKQYKEYWEWVEKRNEARYQSTISHGKRYDAKNMMHVFRLLLMAKEIAQDGKINVWRSDREFLLDIKQGKYEYDELILMADKLRADLPAQFAKSNLPEKPDENLVNSILIAMRENYYSGSAV